MKPVEVATYEERTVWRARQDELRKHKSWTNRKSYYPNNMDDWEAKGKEIVYKYNIQLQELNKKRKQVELEFNISNERRFIIDIELKKEQLKQEQEEKAILNEKRKETMRKNKLDKESNPIAPRRSNRSKMAAAHGLLALRNAQL
jgi:hypothetical protein